MIRQTSGSIAIITTLLITAVTFMVLGLTAFHSEQVWVTALLCIPVFIVAYVATCWEGEDNEPGIAPPFHY